MNQIVPVTAAAEPLARPRLEWCAREGATIAEIVREAMRADPVFRDFPAWGVVIVANETSEITVPRHLWRHTRLKADRVTSVRLAVRLQGSGGGKSIFTTLATIAIIGVSLWVGGAGIPLLGIAGGSFGAQALAAGVGIVGRLALNALAPPATPKQRGGGSPDALGQAGATGVNQLAPFDQIPTVIGRMRVAPRLICPIWIENDGNRRVVHMICGFSGHHTLSDVWINGGSITGADNYTVNIFDGNGGPPNLPDFPRVGASQIINTRLDRYQFSEADTADAAVLVDQTTPDNSLPKWVRYASREDPDEIHINYHLPVGLSRDNADYPVSIIAVQHRIRRRGETAWRMLPSICIYQGNEFKQAPFRVSVRLIFAPFPGGGDLHPGSARGGVGAVVSYAPPDAISGTPAFEADPYFERIDAGEVIRSGSQRRILNGVEIYLDPDEWPKGAYEIETIRSPVMRVDPFASPTFEWTIHTNPWRWFQDGRHVGPKGSGPDRWTVSEVMLEDITSVWNEPPVQADNIAVVAVKASDVEIQSLTVMAQGMAFHWTGSSWGQTPQQMRNPAAWYRQILLGAANNKRPTPQALLDDDNLGDWYEDCQSQGLEVNAYWESGSVEQALQMVAACGHAAVRRSETWAVVIERDRSAETPVQLFTERNSFGFSLDKSFDEKPLAIRATFFDRNNDYAVTERVVYADGYNAGNLPGDALVEAVDCIGLTSAAEVDKRITLDLRQDRYRDKHYLDVAFNSLRAQRGELVGVQHFLLDRHAGSGRVVEVIRDTDEMATGIVVDWDLPLSTVNDLLWAENILAEDDIFSLGTAAVAIELGDGTVITKEVAEAQITRELTFSTPAMLPELRAGLLVTVGAASGAVVKRMLIFDVKPNGPDRARLALVDEAPQIHA
ncbi:hypothetical protein [Rhodoligotrophos ferricapiens]|uniref:hypothetical protein n=1 Tax=Rhodoligotrophos ferricapiens TaxID=3069264 RepID=UPI00315D9789